MWYYKVKGLLGAVVDLTPGGCRKLERENTGVPMCKELIYVRFASVVPLLLLLLCCCCTAWRVLLKFRGI